MSEDQNTILQRRHARYVEQVKKTTALRRSVLTGMLALTAIAFAGGLNVAHAQTKVAAKSVLRIGYQKYGTLTVLKGSASLEKRLAPLGVEVKWTEFPAGPQLLEGLNVGSVDFGTTGEAPPIFAQAAGADLLYVGNEPAAPAGEAIVVPKGSALKSVADLKGKKIVLNKGSNVHYLLVKLLEKAGLAYKDVEVVFLAPPMRVPRLSAAALMPGRSGIRFWRPLKSSSAPACWLTVKALSATTSSISLHALTH
jgi:sulfonate transport system substrate-binding protein